MLELHSTLVVVFKGLLERIQYPRATCLTSLCILLGVCVISFTSLTVIKLSTRPTASRLIAGPITTESVSLFSGGTTYWASFHISFGNSPLIFAMSDKMLV
jgi:hypothetical protein